MSGFEYNGFIHRDLEPQVRYDAEQIELLKQANVAINNKIDALPLGGEKVALTFPSGASEGTITAEQLAVLQANEANYIEMVNDKELYYLNDPGHEEGFLTYSHVGIENSKATIKTLTITVSAKSFVIVTTVVPTESGGGKLYNHWIKIGVADYNFYLSINDNREEAYTAAELSTRYMKGSGFVGLPAVSQQVDATSYTGNVVINVSSGYIFYQGVIPYIEGTSTTPTAIRKSAVTIQSFTDTVTEL